jgi:hypothetical protein
MRVNKYLFRFCTILCLALLFSFNNQAGGQSEGEDAFLSVPETQRTQLIERLHLLVEYQSQQQWGKLYDLLSVTFTEEKSKEDFIRTFERWYDQGLGVNLVDFTAKSIATHDSSEENGWLTISGCAKVKGASGIAEFHAALDARRENSDWYFTPINLITPVGDKPQPCPCDTKKE